MRRWQEARLETDERSKQMRVGWSSPASPLTWRCWKQHRAPAAADSSPWKVPGSVIGLFWMIHSWSGLMWSWELAKFIYPILQVWHLNKQLSTLSEGFMGYRMGNRAANAFGNNIKWKKGRKMPIWEDRLGSETSRPGHLSPWAWRSAPERCWEILGKNIPSVQINSHHIQAPCDCSVPSDF